MQRLKSALTAMAVGIVLIASLDWAASAATGNPTLLGKLNKANAPTTIQNTGSGPAAMFLSNSGAPIAVNRDTKVAKLNADLVDGVNAADLQTETTKLRYTVGEREGDLAIQLPNPGGGHYLITYSIFLLGVTATAAEPTAIECYVQQNDVADEILGYTADQFTAVVSNFQPSLSAAGVLTVDPSDNLIFRCDLEDNAINWSTGSDSPVEITFTRINALTKPPVVEIPSPLP